jgi:hypothetical protein
MISPLKTKPVRPFPGSREDENGSYVRGGRDYAYTRITHAPGVAYAGTIDSCN